MTPIQQIKHAIKALNLPICSGSYGTRYDNGHFLLGEETVCPIGALLLYYQPSGPYYFQYEEAAATLLGVSLDWVDSFIRGVDNDTYEKPTVPEAFRAGKKLIKSIQGKDATRP